MRNFFPFLVLTFLISLSSCKSRDESKNPAVDGVNEHLLNCLSSELNSTLPALLKFEKHLIEHGLFNERNIRQYKFGIQNLRKMRGNEFHSANLEEHNLIVNFFICYEMQGFADISDQNCSSKLGKVLTDLETNNQLSEELLVKVVEDSSSCLFNEDQCFWALFMYMVWSLHRNQ